MRFSNTLLLSLLALLAAGAAFQLLRPTTPHQRFSQIAAQFAKWKLRFGKLYATPAENTYRLDVFKSQLELVETANAKYEAKMASQGQTLSGPMFEINLYADLSEEEYAAMHTGLIESNQEYFDEESEADNSEIAEENQILPSLGQSGYSPRVRYQGGCGSCWAFSSMAEIERIVYHQLGSYVDLAHQELVDCVTECNGCRGGIQIAAFNYILNNGIHKESDYPYKAAQGSCQKSKPGAIRPRGMTIAKHIGYTAERAVKGTQKKVYGAITINAKYAFRYMSASDDVFDGRGQPECSSDVNNHGIALLKLENGVATIMNSGGTHWGNKGFKRMIPCSSTKFFGPTGGLVYPYSF